MRIALAGLVLFFLVLMACLAGTRSLQTRLEAAQNETQKVHETIKALEDLGGLAQVERARGFLKGAADWHTLEAWWHQRAQEQRQRLREGKLEWGHP